jgi:hypothetical protein
MVKSEYRNLDVRFLTLLLHNHITCLYNSGNSSLQELMVSLLKLMVSAICSFVSSHNLSMLRSVVARREGLSIDSFEHPFVRLEF